MDGISAAASILTVLEAGFQSAVWVHKTLSAMERAPTVVTSLTADLSVLQSLLLQLKNCDMVKIDANNSLKVAISRCADDLRHFAHDLGSLTINSDNGQAGKLWKRIRTVSREHALRDAQDRMQRHVQVLTLGLNVIQRYCYTRLKPKSNLNLVWRLELIRVGFVLVFFLAATICHLRLRSLSNSLTLSWRRTSCVAI